MTAYFSPSVAAPMVSFGNFACMVGTMAIDPLVLLGLWTEKECGVSNAYLDPREVNIRISQNNNPTFDIQVQDDDGAYVDVSDITALEWRIARSNAATATLSKSLGDFSTVNTTTWRIQLTAAETATLLPARYHEVTMTDTGGRIRTVIAGRFQCINRIAGD